MKTTSTLWPFLVLLALLSGTAPAQEMRVLTEVSPPYNYIQDDRITGSSTEIVREILRRHQEPDNIQVLPWARGYKLLQTRPHVALFSTTRTPEREDQFHWIGPLFKVHFGFYARRDSGLQLDSLEDAKQVGAIATYKDDVKEQLLIRMGFTNLDSSKSPANNLKKLINGRVDLWLFDNVGMTDLARQQNIDPAALEINGVRRHFESRLVADSETQAVAIVRDITVRFNAAAEREKLEERLRRAQKMEAIGMLAGGVAHDLNNVLSGLVSYPEILLMDLPADHPFRRPILTIQKSGEKAAHIVQDLLTLARRGVPVAEVVNLNQLIREFLNSPELEKLRSYYDDFDIRLELEDELLNTVGSPIHLAKTIMNLVSNAVEALTGGGTIAIATENRYVDRPLRGYDDIAPGDYVVMTVADNGAGISPEDIDCILEPFYTKKVMGRSGTGLGMAVVWGTVKDHRGYIEVESKVARGTRVTVYLPASRRRTAEQAAAKSIEQSRGHGETILVVDDIPEQLEIASQILERLGYRVATAASGLDALAYLEKHAVALVILDMIMDPGIDGLETYRRIKAIYPDQKAVIASGYSETARVHEAQSLGAGAYIKKPYLLEKIGMAVREELDR